MKRLFSLWIALCACLPGTAGAATFFVNAATGLDTNNCTSSATACLTIQAALDLADLTPEDDTVNVAAGTYNTSLLEAIAEINSNVSLVGASAQTTIIDGMDSSVGVWVTGPSVTATISNMTIQNGFDNGSQSEGPGIRNYGNLTLDTVVVQNNETGDDNGGGIFSGNDTGASLTIFNSTISGNTANGQGGGIANGGPGGGNNDPGTTSTLVMVNSTVSGNTSGSNVGGESAGGGIYNHNTSTATLFNVTIANNTANNVDGTGGDVNGGGGLYNNGGTVTINNTLIANNTDASAVDANDCFGTLNSTEGYNLVEDLNGCTLGGNTVGNLTEIDPGIGNLQNNGGTTSTHALLSGSAAIDSGDPDGCVNNTGADMTEDQRGSTRPVAGIEGDIAICDIGAFEAAAGTTPEPDSGGCSLAALPQSSAGYGMLSFVLLGVWSVWRRLRS